MPRLLESGVLDLEDDPKTSSLCRQAGSMILKEGDEGDEVSDVVRRLHCHALKLCRADVVRGSGSALEHLAVDASNETRR